MVPCASFLLAAMSEGGFDMSEIRDKIHELFGVKEPHELPAAMMKQLQAGDSATGKEFREFVELFEEWTNL